MTVEFLREPGPRIITELKIYQTDLKAQVCINFKKLACFLFPGSVLLSNNETWTNCNFILRP